MLPRYEISLKQSLEGVKSSRSRVLEEGLTLGFRIRSIIPDVGSSVGLPPNGLMVPGADDLQWRRLPPGHRFFHDCCREQEARLIEWAIKRFYPDCWFFTQTFHYEICPERALRFHSAFTARLARSKYDVTGCKQLTYLSCGEWQQRDVYHFHSIFFGRGLAELSRKRWESRWLKLSGGFGSCYGAELRAAPYLAKHNSRRYGELQIGGDWRGLTLPAGLSRCCSAPALDSVTLLRMG